MLKGWSSACPYWVWDPGEMCLMRGSLVTEGWLPSECTGLQPLPLSSLLALWGRCPSSRAQMQMTWAFWYLSWWPDLTKPLFSHPPCAQDKKPKLSEPDSISFNSRFEITTTIICGSDRILRANCEHTDCNWTVRELQGHVLADSTLRPLTCCGEFLEKTRAVDSRTGALRPRRR